MDSVRSVIENPQTIVWDAKTAYGEIVDRLAQKVEAKGPEFASTFSTGVQTAVVVASCIGVTVAVVRLATSLRRKRTERRQREITNFYYNPLCPFALGVELTLASRGVTRENSSKHNYNFIRIAKSSEIIVAENRGVFPDWAEEDGVANVDALRAVKTWYKERINPAGTLPTTSIMFHGRRSVYESAVQAEMVDALRSNWFSPPSLPSDPVTRAVVQNDIQHLPTMKIFSLLVNQDPEKDGELAVQASSSVAAFARRVREHRGGPFFFGSTPSVVDYLAVAVFHNLRHPMMTFRSFDLFNPGDASDASTLAEWFDAVSKLPRLAHLFARTLPDEYDKHYQISFLYTSVAVDHLL